jgi:wyosine [tRNA(Phe)-imidazoG37] synthetase (radical SAM superfamily)
MRIQRAEFYKPEEIYREAENKLKQLAAEGKKADYFSFVPDGEPTLDLNLGKTIKLLKPLNVKIAVITNASLLWMDEVKEDLLNADWVSVSIDGSDEETWRKIDRPHRQLNHQRILDGIIDFSKQFQGTLVTETMLVQDINDHEACIEAIAEQIAVIQPSKAYLLVPTRPPAESNVNRPSPETLKNAAAIIQGTSGVLVEGITDDDEEEGFFFTENIANDILGIASVHPIREDIIDQLLKKRGADKGILTQLLNQGDLVAYQYEGKTFYRRVLQKK